MEPALELVDLTKRFGDTTAVDGVSLSLEPGAFLGLLGRNGVGKSTTLKMVAGLLKPTSGRIRVLGLDLEVDPLAVKRQIGAMPEDMALLDMLISPFRALLTAHGQATWNQPAREMGRQGLWAMILLMGILVWLGSTLMTVGLLLLPAAAATLDQSREKLVEALG